MTLFGSVSQDASLGLDTASAAFPPLLPFALGANLLSAAIPSGGSQSGTASGGAVSPYTTSGGLFGIGSHTIPGLTDAPPSPTYANTLQFGPLPQMAMTAPQPLTPMASPMPLAGPTPYIPASSGGAMMPIANSAPTAISPQATASGMPLPQQQQMMPQVPQAPQMPFISPPSVQQQTSPTSSGAVASPPAAAPVMSPWQAAAVNQAQQAGLSPANMFQATMPTALGLVGPVPGPPPGSGQSIFPELNPQGQAQQASFASNATPSLPTQGGASNLVKAAAGYPEMLAQGLQGAMDNVNSFNNALKNGSQQIETAANVIKAGILAQPEKEIKDLLENQKYSYTDKDGKAQEGTLPQYRKHLQDAIEAANEKIDNLNEEYRNATLTPKDEIESQANAEAFTQGLPKKQQARFTDWASRGFETSALGRKLGVIAGDMAALDAQRSNLQTQATYLDSRIDAVRNRYQAAQVAGNTAAQGMRDGYYKLADNMLGGVKGINELQAQTIRGFIADQQSQSQIAHMAQQNQLTAQKIQNEADAQIRTAAFNLANAGRQAQQAAQHDKVSLVNEAVKKLAPGLPPEKISKFMNDMLNAITVDKAESPHEEQNVFALMKEQPKIDILGRLKKGPNG